MKYVLTSLGYLISGLWLQAQTTDTVGKQVQLQEVEVGTKKATRLELTPMNVEVINSNDLVKDACCNLSESFENTATIDVNFTDAVSGAKEIRMLGVDGIYTQISIENVQSIRSLGNTFGLTYIPGPLMNSIQVNKGAGSVVNGYESMTGQINVELKKPQNADRLYANLFMNQDLRTELNLISAHKINDKWSTLSSVNGQLSLLKIDMNHDHYLDNPLVKNINLFHRLSYNSGKKFNFILGAGATVEERRGGSIHFTPAESRLTQND
nr:TonB-dependent receptor plug domain-containing protein [Chitinophagales bacterium]